MNQELANETAEVRRLQDENRIIEREIAKTNDSLQSRIQFIEMKQKELEERAQKLMVDNRRNRFTQIEMKGDWF